MSLKQIFASRAYVLLLRGWGGFLGQRNVTGQKPSIVSGGPDCLSCSQLNFTPRMNLPGFRIPTWTVFLTEGVFANHDDQEAKF